MSPNVGIYFSIVCICMRYYWEVLQAPFIFASDMLRNSFPLGMGLSAVKLNYRLTLNPCIRECEVLMEE